MKKILLVDIDSKTPNLALMKISSYAKSKGYTVTLVRCNCTGYEYQNKPSSVIDAINYDYVFVSIIFSCNKNKVSIANCKKILIGGTGYDVKVKLPLKIDSQVPDYSIYPENITSYGFITRGCIRKCYFCLVPEKEGGIAFYQHPKEIIKHAAVDFLDNNFLAYDKHLEILEWLVENKIKYRFQQGLDIRLITPQSADLLMASKYIGDYIFAFDDIKYTQSVARGLEVLKKAGLKDWKAKFYIYCNNKMNIKNEIIARVEWCKENKVLPYLMRDANCYDRGNHKTFYATLAAWCNRPPLFKNNTFKEFAHKRTKNIKTQQRNIDIYYECRKLGGDGE